MSSVEEGETLCFQCQRHPPIGERWYFNRMISLGNYKTYPNEPYNNIPKNILSKMILTLKGNVKKPKEKVGKIFANGLAKISHEFNFLTDDLKYILIPPKFNSETNNQCKFILKPLIKIFKSEGINLIDLSEK